MQLTAVVNLKYLMDRLRDNNPDKLVQVETEGDAQQNLLETDTELFVSCSIIAYLPIPYAKLPKSFLNAY